ncbi:MAG: hypothetical protein H6811_04455 [Phycisphaeraceae bacterium]|nr:hypothetical protein [Phycisphaeraceae bacterium]
MLFTGFAELTVDAKGRLAIPAKYRNKWNAQRDGMCWVCVPWPDGVLRLYTEAQFERLSARQDDSLTPHPDDASLDRLFFSRAEELVPDTAGRVMLPKHHVDWTNLPSEVVVVGARNRLEVMSRERWKSNADKEFRQLPELVERIESRKRTTDR